MFENKRKISKLLLRACKLSVGSSLAIYIARFLNLEYATTAGTIALLTIATTKWGTLRLSLNRIITFFISAFLCGIVFTKVESDWIAYGIFIFMIVVMCDVLKWPTVLSVNALIGMHFLTHMNEYNRDFVFNEFMLLIIGISISILLNMFHAYKYEERHLIKCMRNVEIHLKETLLEVSEYLSNHEEGKNAWKDIGNLETELEEYIQHATEYQDNTFNSHPGYYIEYFEMRYLQCKILHSLQKEMKKIRTKPVQAKVIADYIAYLAEYIVEKNVPVEQQTRLELIFENMRKADLPETREEFESRALLYHVLMDLEEFLNCKKRFVENLDEVKLKKYWNS